VIRIKFGEQSPVVATLQCLLNRVVPDAALTVDGIYGRNTRAAVQDFQSHANLPTSAHVEGSFWRALMDETGYQTVDVVDVGDPGLVPYFAQLRTLGANPIELNPQCNGVGVAVQRIRFAAPKPASIVLLRFDGHGWPGHQMISAGQEGGVSPSGAVIMSGNVPLWVRWNATEAGVNVETAIDSALRSIKPLLAPFGSVQFHGCRIGLGQTGGDFLREMTDVFGVPASGGVKKQWGNAYEFEGPARHLYPGGTNLRSWSRSIRSYGEMTFA
jgi:peptidoglycan hydrolase-like protein with peptidoglycan-binding domain